MKFEWKCTDLKCIWKPTRSQLSLTHWQIQPLSRVKSLDGATVRVDRQELRRRLINCPKRSLSDLLTAATNAVDIVWVLHHTVQQLLCAGDHTSTTEARWYWLLLLSAFDTSKRLLAFFTFHSMRRINVYDIRNKRCLANLPNRYSALCWRPVTYAQTWASYSALYRFGRLSRFLSNITSVRQLRLYRTRFYRLLHKCSVSGNCPASTTSGKHWV